MQGRLLGLVGLVCFVLCINCDLSAQVVYVDKSNSSGDEDGTSWATAYTAIQPALDAAGVAGEVWVAAGVYDEVRSGEEEEAGAIKLPAGLKIYGGFAGGESSRDARDWENNVTVLDGSTARDGEPANHVVMAEDGVTLDGFTVTGGYAEFFGGPGVGLYGFLNGRIENCIVTDNTLNHPYAQGSGLYALGSEMEPSTILLNNVRFENNEAASGMVVYFRYVDAEIVACTFENNIGRKSSRGALSSRGGTLTMSDSRFIGNAGHAMALLEVKSFFLDQVEFTGNEGGGLLIFAAERTDDTAMGEIKNCLFVRICGWFPARAGVQACGIGQF